MTYVLWERSLMKRINDRALLNHYIAKYKIAELIGEDLLKEAFLCFFEKDSFVMEADTELRYFYIMVDGKVRVSYGFENGKSMFLKFYQGFNTLGDLELMKELPVLCNVEAVNDSYFVMIPVERMREDGFQNVRMLKHLVGSLSEKLYATINNSSYNYIYPLPNRLASYLSEHLSVGNEIQLKSSYEEIAQFLGTTYRHLNRTFKELEGQGLIRYEGKRIYVLDAEGLRKLSKNLYIQSI